MMKKHFGTDGIRGRVGTVPITPEFMLKLGWAAGRILAKGHSKVLIGKDTRISGYMFESVLEAGLCSAGVDIGLLGPMPTPAIAYLTRTLHAQAGIVISASHNPHYDNGIKFFNHQGFKLDDALELAIETQLEQPMAIVDSEHLGKATRIADGAGRYIEFCKSTIPSHIDLNGLKIVVDCAHGATYHIAPFVFTERGATVHTIGNQPNGLNINHECGALHLQWLQQEVLKHQADLGIAFDGDGDRLMMVDHHGEIVDGDELLFIIAQARAQQQQLRGSVVGTLMSNLGLEHALRDRNIGFHRTKVGDRYVMEMLTQSQWSLGGESSGHIICLDRTSTGDGIVAALQILATLHDSGKSLHELKQGMSKYPQRMINVTVHHKIDLAHNEPIQQAIQAIEQELNGTGRVLLRASGTEPVIRVMVEGQDSQQVTRLSQQLADTVLQVTGCGNKALNP